MSIRSEIKSVSLSSGHFAKDESAVTVVEFALLSPAFFGITFMIVQLGLYQLYGASLSYATQRAARQILVGNVANTANITMPIFLNTFVCPNLPPPMSCSRVIVNIKTVTSPYSSGTTSSWWTLMNAQGTGLLSAPMDNTKTSFCIGQSGSIVAFQMYYAMPAISFPFFATPASTFNGASAFWIVSTAAFRNEPFMTSYSGC